MDTEQNLMAPDLRDAMNVISLLARVDDDHGSTNLDALHDLSLVAFRLSEAFDLAVAASRLDGATWAQIGQALGITRQAAQKRFSTPAVAAVQLDTLDLGGAL